MKGRACRWQGRRKGACKGKGKSGKVGGKKRRGQCSQGRCCRCGRVGDTAEEVRARSQSWLMQEIDRSIEQADTFRYIGADEMTDAVKLKQYTSTDGSQLKQHTSTGGSQWMQNKITGGVTQIQHKSTDGPLQSELTDSVK